MAENNNYVLTLNFSDLEEVVGSTSADKQKQEQDKKIRAVKNFARTQIIRPFINTAQNVITTKVNIISGQQQLKERWDALGTIAQSGVAVAGAISGGVALASALGMSNVLGAVIGASALVVGKSLDLLKESNRISSLKYLEDKQTQQLEQRAGYAFNKTRRGA